MRKHFLILMLLAILPLAGWAAESPWDGFADLSDGWSIRLEATARTYTGVDIRPHVQLVKTVGDDTYYINEGKFNVSWSHAEVIDYLSGGYTVTVTSDETNTWGELAQPTAKFMVMKANVDEATAGVLNDDALVYHNGDAFNLLKSNGGTPETFKEPVAQIVGTTTKVPVLYSIDNKTTWLAAGVLPTASQVGTYSVWYKVEAQNNYNAFEKKIGDIAIAGTPQEDGTDYDAPTINGGASTISENHFTFAWDNVKGAPVAQKLLTDNTGKMKKAASGTMYFKVNDGDWSTERPTASAAGTYVISWKIVGGVGMADVAATVLGTKIIDKADVTITFTEGANAKTGQKYNVTEGHERALLKKAATTANGAPVKYQTRYKATSAEEYPVTWSATKYTNYLDVKGTNAGYYQVRAFVEGEDNYNDNGTTDPIEVQIAKTDQYFTTAPAAATLTYTGANQPLITATPSEAGLVKYSVAAGNGQDAITDQTDITAIVGKNAGDYVVTYEVAGNDNFVATAAPVTITGTKINKKDMSVKVNNITKSYNGQNDFDGATVDGTNPVVAANPATDEKRFTFMGRVDDGVDFGTVAYKALDESCKNAGSYTNAVTVTEEALNAKSENYIYTIIPGNLTIAKSKLTVTAKDDIEVLFGTVYDISNEYNVDGVAAGEELTDVFSTLPVLYTDAPTPNPAPKAYDLFFTKGTLKATNNYEMSDAGDDGYVIGAAKFTVVADPDAKIIITVLPHTQTYTGVGEDWSGIQSGVDYVVTGLINGDALTVAPQFKRKDYNDDDDATNDKFGVGVYDLEAYGAEVADLSRYPGKIVYQKSTFTITPAPLTVTVNQQTVPVSSAATALDKNEWTVEGLVGPDVKKDLNGTLAFNTTYGETAEKANVATPGSYAKGIVLTIDNDNYELKGANVNTTDATKAYGRLIVIAANTIALQVTDEDLQTKLTAAQTADVNYQVTFAGDSRVMEAKEWYAMVLPFETTPLELAKNLNTYVVVNVLKSSKIEYVSGTGHNRDEAIVNFGIEMDKIPAGTPFLIKPAAKTKWNTVENATNIYTPRKIKAAVVPAVTDKATLSATYETGKSLQWGYELDGTTENADMKYRWLANTTDLQAGSTTEYRDNAWYNCKSNAHALEPMEAFLILDPAAQGARIFVEDFENGTTAIKSLNADQVNGLKVAEGWYTINGVKLQGMPTEKGIYINNGKKVVVK